MRKRPFFQFKQLGYQQNPFGALTAAEWARMAVLPAAIETVVLAASHHVQVLGPKGIGKSTTLRKAVALLEMRGETAVYEYVPDGQDSFTQAPVTGSVFALDEAQRLRRAELARLQALVGQGDVRLLLGSHSDVVEQLAGLERPWRTFWLTEMVDVAHVDRLLATRLAAFALPDRPRVTLDTAVPAYLYARFGQDLREMEYFLYEVWQSLVEVCVVDMAYLEEFGR